ncbi:MAG: ATP-binding protein [Thiogranum sp.]
MSTALSRTKRSFYRFLLVLGAFLVLADALIISQVYLNSLEHEQEHAGHETRIFTKLIAEALTRGDYSSVEYMVRQWARERQDIAHVVITTANGFTLAEYRRDTGRSPLRRYHESFEYGDQGEAIIDLVLDVSDIYRQLTQLVVQLVLFSILIAGLLGYFLRQVAIRPLQEEITEHRRTGQQLEQRTQALAASNSELEAYSYSMAHDLRTPLRAITSFSQILKLEAADKLSDEERNYIDRIVRAGQRMAQLIDELLELARISRTELQVSRVDLGELANAILEQQKHAGPERNVDCTIAPDLVVQGDPKLLRVALENLLGNAWKYTGKTGHANIEFGTTRRDDRRIFYIRDNGSGFDMQYADKLFQPFQRLHNAEDFEGTGIGLASVQHIIQRHGGSIWAEAQPGQGATFYFTLPD